MGVSSARTAYPETISEVHALKDSLDYPVYVKPYYSHLWQLAFPDTPKGVKIFTPSELVRIFERIFPTGSQAMVQEIITGPASNVQSARMYINNQRDVLGSFSSRKIRQFPSEFGNGTMSESFHDADFLDMGLRFFRDIDYRGFGFVEFKRDDRDSQLKITNLNLRWGKSVNLATDCGIDFPLMHYRDLVGDTPAPQHDYTEGVRWLDAVGDFATSWSMMRSGELSPLSWARQWASARSFGVFARDDIKPFLKEYQYGRRVLRAPLRMLRRR